MAHDEHERPDAARTAVVGPGKATFVTTSIHESHVAEGTYVASAHDAHLGIRSRQNDELETQLREKVKSKMEEAKLLGGVVAVVLGLFVNAEAVKGLGNPLEVRLAAVSFLVSLVLFLGTVDAYDSLLMPREYWNRGFKRWKHNTRRRKEDPRTLRDAMIHTWRWFFCPAAVALVLGVTLLADAAVDPRWSWRIVGAVAVVITVAYVYLARPISVKSRDS